MEGMGERRRREEGYKRVERERVVFGKNPAFLDAQASRDDKVARSPRSLERLAVFR